MDNMDKNGQIGQESTRISKYEHNLETPQPDIDISVPSIGETTAVSQTFFE